MSTPERSAVLKSFFFPRGSPPEEEKGREGRNLHPSARVTVGGPELRGRREEREREDLGLEARVPRRLRDREGDGRPRVLASPRVGPPLAHQIPNSSMKLL